MTQPVEDEEDALEKATSDEYSERSQALLNGEVVPLHDHPDHVAMGGIDPEEETDDNFELVNHLHEDWVEEAGRPGDPHPIDEHMEGFRFIEARSNPSSGGSTVTASWSADDDFEPPFSVGDPEAGGGPVDDEVPACISCERLNRMAALDEDEPYVVNQFQARENPESIQRFYHRAMTERGWKRSESTRILDDVAPHVPELRTLRQRHGEMETYQRGNEFLNVYVGPDDAGLNHSSVIAIQGQQQ